VKIRIATLLLVCLSAANASAFSAQRPARVLYVGDSLAANTAEEVVAGTQARSTSVVTTYSAFPGMAICDFLDVESAQMPIADRLHARIKKARPDLVILQFWGNSFTDCMADAPTDSEAYFLRYFADAETAVAEIELAAAAAGIARPRILWVLQGPDPDSPERTALLNAIYSLISAVHGDRTSDAGWTLSYAAHSSFNDDDVAAARKRWVQYLPCTDDERGTPFCTHPDKEGGAAQLHRDDDPIHFCLGEHVFYFGCDAPSPAIRRYGTRIARDANAWLGIH